MTYKYIMFLVGVRGSFDVLWILCVLCVLGHWGSNAGLDVYMNFYLILNSFISVTKDLPHLI